MSTAHHRKILRREEWDFSKVSDLEREACFLWECAREFSDGIAGLISDIECLPDDNPIKKSPSEWASYTGVLPAAMLVGRTHLLDTPFQLLAPKIREDCASFGIQPFTETEINDLRVLDTLKEHRGEGTNIICFEIDWNASDSQILEGASNWLIANRKKRPKERRGNSHYDVLNMLGAMRLLHHYTWEEAASLTSSVLGKPLYGKRPSWERARLNGVDAVIAHLYFEDPAEAGDEELLLDEMKSYRKFKRSSNSKKKPPSETHG